MITSELKPCPFCGRPAQLWQRRDWLPDQHGNEAAAQNAVVIKCDHTAGCLLQGATLPSFRSVVDATHAWNRREGTDEVRAAILEQIAKVERSAADLRDRQMAVGMRFAVDALKKTL